MTPTRAVLGAVVVGAVGFAAIHSASSPGPRYLGDFPSIMAKSTAAPAPITHAAAGPSVPDPPHYAAHPVVPDKPAAPPPDVAGIPPVPPPAPVGGPAPSGPNAASPGVGSPLTGPLNPGSLLNPLVGSLPPLDLSTYCVMAGKIVALVPCDQIPPVPPVVPAAP